MTIEQIEKNLESHVKNSTAFKSIPEYLDAYLTKIDIEKEFGSYLAESNEEFQICGYTYYPNEHFEDIDPIAYREEFLNWIDYEYMQSENNLYYIAIPDGDNSVVYWQADVVELIETKLEKKLYKTKTSKV